jgi:hypothetical protein
MAFGIFIHRSDSIYDDIPSERYQFPKQYLSRAQQCEGDWIVYLEPSKVKETKKKPRRYHIESSTTAYEISLVNVDLDSAV